MKDHLTTSELRDLIGIGISQKYLEGIGMKASLKLKSSSYWSDDQIPTILYAIEQDIKNKRLALEQH